MKLRSSKTIVLALAGVVCLSGVAFGQLETNLGALSGDNAEGYMGPLPEAISGTLNSSIFHTGYVPKSQFGIQLEFHAMTISFDDKDRTYSPTDPTGFQSAEDIKAPTIIGDTHAVSQAGQSGTVLYHPGGFDLENFTLAAPQLTIGSIMGTRAVVRWLSIDLGDADLGDLSLFGIGAQHSVTQYMVEPPVDVAVGVFYQTFTLGDDIIDSNMLHLNATGSKRYGILEPYLGLGYDTFDMKVKYTSDVEDVNTDVEVEFDGESNAHFTVGMRVNLTNVTAHAEFNSAARTGFAVGFSLGL